MTEENRQSTGSSSASGKRSRSKRRRSSRANTLVVVLGALLGVTVFLLIAVSVTLGGRVTSLSNANEVLGEELFKYEQELKELRPRLATSERELKMLMEGRFPHLTALTPDEVIPVGDQYVRNIVFTVTNHGSEQVYEYKLVMENPYRYKVHPNFRVLVFDKMGVQVGVDSVVAGEDLGVGESRSHSSILDVFMNSQPRYFAIDFESRGAPESGNGSH